MTWLPPPDQRLRAAYLRRLGLPEAATPPAPSVPALFAIHRAHLERVPYENLWIWLGEPRSIDPLDSVRQVVAGRGGYCYHLNGALATLLGWLGFDVRWHVGGVQGLSDQEYGPNGNHLALTVAGLPAPANPGGVWLVDAGLGDGPHEPLPLLAGEYRQGPFTYQVRPSTAPTGQWRFDADPRMSLRGMDLAPAGATPADFQARHEYLRTHPNSGFVQVLTVFRRDATGIDLLRGRVHTRIDATGSTRTDLTTATHWFATLADVFGLPLPEVTAPDRAALWHRVDQAHQRHQARRASA